MGGRFACRSERLPAMRQEFDELVAGYRGQAMQHIDEIGERFDLSCMRR